jgi:hypothetical protein
VRGRPFTVQWRDENGEDALKAAYLSERDGVIRSRRQALWLLRGGPRTQPHLDATITATSDCSAPLEAGAFMNHCGYRSLDPP